MMKSPYESDDRVRANGQMIADGFSHFFARRVLLRKSKLVTLSAFFAFLALGSNAKLVMGQGGG